MCERCLAALNEHWPGLDWDEQYAVLIGATAYPFADAETTAAQLKDMAKRSGRDVGKALAIADEDTWAAMRAAENQEPTP